METLVVELSFAGSNASHDRVETKFYGSLAKRSNSVPLSLRDANILAFPMYPIRS
jgi:hypothetical protein